MYSASVVKVQGLIAMISSTPRLYGLASALHVRGMCVKFGPVSMVGLLVVGPRRDVWNGGGTGRERGESGAGAGAGGVPCPFAGIRNFLTQEFSNTRE